MENNNEKQLKVSAIKNGTVLDPERYSTTYPPDRSSR